MAILWRDPNGELFQWNGSTWQNINEQIYTTMGVPTPGPNQFYDTDTGKFGSKASDMGIGAGGTGNTGTGQPPAAQPPMGSPPPAATPPVGGNGPGNSDIEVQSPWVAYMKQLGLLDKEYLTPGQEYQSSLYSPWNAAYNVANQMAVTGVPGAAPVGSFTGYAQDPSNAYQNAQAMLRSLLNLNPEQRAKAGLGYEGDVDSGIGSNSEFRSLLGAGLVPTYGGATSRWLSSRVPNEQERWRAQQIATGGGNSFLDYLRGKYNLQI